MTVAGNHAVAVIDNDGITEQAFFTGEGHNAVGRGQDRSSLARGNIICLVKFAFSGKGGFAIAEFGSDPGLYTSGYRTDRRRRGQQILLIFKRS